MTDASTVFWGAAIRHLLTVLCTALIAHGYVTQSGAQAYIEELTGLILNLAVMAWSQRQHYWDIMQRIVARSLHHAATDDDVAAVVAELKACKALPSVFTPRDEVVPLTTKSSKEPQ